MGSSDPSILVWVNGKKKTDSVVCEINRKGKAQVKVKAKVSVSLNKEPWPVVSIARALEIERALAGKKPCLEAGGNIYTLDDRGTEIYYTGCSIKYVASTFSAASTLEHRATVVFHDIVEPKLGPLYGAFASVSEITGGIYQSSSEYQAGDRSGTDQWEFAFSRKDLLAYVSGQIKAEELLYRSVVRHSPNKVMREWTQVKMTVQ